MTRTMTRTHRPLTLAALRCCAAFALLQAGAASRADLNITTFPYTISGNVSGNVTISNPNHFQNRTVTIAPGASITGSVTVWNDCVVNSSGYVGGTVAAHNSSYVSVTNGIMGKLFTYDSSGVSLQGSGQASVTLAGLECFNNSRAYAQGHALSGHAHSINVKYLYLHDVAAANMTGIDAPSGLWTEGSSYTGLSQSTIGFQISAGASQTDMDTTYCSAGMMQFDSSTIHVHAGTTVMSVVNAYGWNGDMPKGATYGGITTDGGTFYRGLNAAGGVITISGANIVNGPLYADPAVASTPYSMRIYGHSLKISSAGRLTGFVGGWPIDVPCSGDVQLVNN